MLTVALLSLTQRVQVRLLSVPNNSVYRPKVGHFSDKEEIPVQFGVYRSLIDNLVFLRALEGYGGPAACKADVIATGWVRFPGARFTGSGATEAWPLWKRAVAGSNPVSPIF